jgi:Uma2 family endonuclease
MRSNTEVEIMSAISEPTGAIPSDTLYEVVNGKIVILDQMPETVVPDDVLYEVVNGQIVELPPMGAFEVDIATMLSSSLCSYAATHKMGRAETEMMFILDAAKGLKRRPDIAVVTYGRWPRKRRVPRAEAWNVVPDLAVEVVSPSNTANEILAKIHEYFQAGCKRVWVVYPLQEQIYVYQSPSQLRILNRQDELDGEDILPGFRLPLATLFEADMED